MLRGCTLKFLLSSVYESIWFFFFGCGGSSLTTRGLFSSCGEQRLLFSVLPVASLDAEDGALDAWV